jgi:hypothetical protein
LHSTASSAETAVLLAVGFGDVAVDVGAGPVGRNTMSRIATTIAMRPRSTTARRFQYTPGG